MKNVYLKCRNMSKNFISKVLVLVAFLMSGLFSCFAEDSYRQLLEQALLSTNGVQSKEKVMKTFAPILIKAGCPEKLAMEKAGKFYDEVFYNDVLDWMESTYKPIASEDDLKAALAFYNSPEGKLSLEHSKVYSGEEFSSQAMTKMYPDIVKIVMGEKPDKLKSSLPSSYQKLFQEYYKLAGFETSMGMMVEQIISLVSGENDKYDKQLVKYFKDGMWVLLMDGGYPTVTEDDLKSLVNFYKSPAGKKISEVNTEVLRGAVKFGVSEAMKFQMTNKNWNNDLGKDDADSEGTIEYDPVEMGDEPVPPVEVGE